MSRVETGVIQFEADWPGIFIRGDNALNLARILKRLTRRIDADPELRHRLEHTDLINIRSLQAILESCDASLNPEVQRPPLEAENTRLKLLVLDLRGALELLVESLASPEFTLEAFKAARAAIDRAQSIGGER